MKAEVFADGTLELPPPFTSPARLDVLNALPVPRTDPDEAGLPRAALEARAACQGALRSGKPDAARRALGAAHLSEWHWLRHWYVGLIAALAADVPGAVAEFTAVRQILPGELVPMLALGLCAERTWDLEGARTHYEAVARTAPALGAAGYGLARVHLLAGRRAEAVRAAEQLADASEFRLAPGPQIAGIRLLVALPDTTACAPPSEANLTRAGNLLAALGVDEETRTALEVEIEYARYTLTGDGSELSETVRRVAGSAKTKNEYVALIDLANRLRPRVKWPVPDLSALRRAIRKNHRVAAS